METKLTTNIVKLPKVPESDHSSSDALRLAERWRSFRLHALITAPEAFAASYEMESQQGIEKMVERMSNPKATHFVAVSIANPEHDTGSTSEKVVAIDTPWVGTIVLLGPLTEESSTRITAKKDPWTKVAASDHVAGIEASTIQVGEGGQKTFDSMHFHLNGMFVDTQARGQGLGLALIQAALAEATQLSQAGDCESLKATILVDAYNTAARRLYQKAGFGIVGEEVYQQQPRALVVGEEARMKRVALLMEHVRILSHETSA